MDPISVHDYESLARERLSPVAWAYYSGGAGDEITMREERAAFERVRLLPRVLSRAWTGPGHGPRCSARTSRCRS